MNPQEIRERIHQLVDRRPEEDLPAARRVLEGLQALTVAVLRLTASDLRPMEDSDMLRVRSVDS